MKGGDRFKFHSVAQLKDHVRRLHDVDIGEIVAFAGDFLAGNKPIDQDPLHSQPDRRQHSTVPSHIWYGKESDPPQFRYPCHLPPFVSATPSPAGKVHVQPSAAGDICDDERLFTASPLAQKRAVPISDEPRSQGKILAVDPRPKRTSSTELMLVHSTSSERQGSRSTRNSKTKNHARHNDAGHQRLPLPKERHSTRERTGTPENEPQSLPQLPPHQDSSSASDTGSQTQPSTPSPPNSTQQSPGQSRPADNDLSTTMTGQHRDGMTMTTTSSHLLIYCPVVTRLHRYARHQTRTCLVHLLTPTISTSGTAPGTARKLLEIAESYPSSILNRSYTEALSLAQCPHHQQMIHRLRKLRLSQLKSIVV